MHSVSELQKKAQSLTDQINDIFYATKLNLEALGVQVEAYNQSKVVLSTLKHCQKEFQNIEQLYQQRQTLRLEYLITEQIKEQEAKVRRERLAEYEDKIYDQRRLISDKQAFYEGLLKPRKKRPAQMTIEQFQNMRRQEILNQQRKNLKRLDQQTHELKLIEKALKADNDQLQKLSELLEKESPTQEEIMILENALNKNPTMYDNISKLPYKRDDKYEVKKLYQNVMSIQQENNELYKQYMEEKELYQYLRWEHAKLKEQYQRKESERVQNQIQFKNKFDKMVKYRFKRSCSI